LGDWDERQGATPAQVKQRARDKKVPYFRDAVVDLPAVAQEVAAAKARIEAVMPIRNASMTALKNEGVSRKVIAELSGCAPSRVSHITSDRS